MRYGLLVLIGSSLAASGAEPRAKPGDRLPRSGDEIVVCGQLYHTTTKVVLWTDPGGYDAYRVERRFSPRGRGEPQAPGAAKRTSNAAERGGARYGLRTRGPAPDQIERVRGGGWDLPLLQQVVDQFVIHFDACGTSRRCFQVLQDQRGLSVHFMLDLDGTIYQTLDVKESAWHATIANGRSIGVEIANIGAYPLEGPNPLDRWYRPDRNGRARVADPEPLRSAGREVGQLELRPLRNEPIVGTIQGKKLKQFDYTPQQYEALARLSATLCILFPKICCDYPRDERGVLLSQKLTDAEYARYRGIL